MKRIYLVLSIFISLKAFGQDTIVKKTGDLLPARIIAIDQDHISYTRMGDQDNTPYQIEKSLVSEIRYHNGTRDVFNTAPASNAVPPATAVPHGGADYSKPLEETMAGASGQDRYLKGQEDAVRYYKGYKGAGTGTVVTSLISPLVGLIPAIACSSTMPKDMNLNYPKAEKMKDADYNRGYRTRAKKIKQGKVWMNWGIGLAVNVVLVLALEAGQP